MHIPESVDNGLVFVWVHRTIHSPRGSYRDTVSEPLVQSEPVRLAVGWLQLVE